MSKQQEEREQWLKSLKEGDTVICKKDTIWYKYTNIKQFKVTKITPKGWIRLDNDVLLNPEGYNSTQGIYIHPYDEEVKEYLKYREFVNKCSNYLDTMDKMVNRNYGLSRYFKDKRGLMSKEQQEKLLKKLEECCNLILDFDN